MNKMENIKESGKIATLAEAVAMPRQMCMKLTLGKPANEANAHDIEMLQRALQVHGAISLVGFSSLSPEELKQFAQKWGEVLRLPAELTGKSQDRDFPEVVRVGNVKLDGSIVKKHTWAQYWHHDGDFWEPEQNHIVNFLNAVEVPSQGGNTGFLDTRKAYLALSPEEKAELKGAYSVVDCNTIPDFAKLPEDQERPIVRHDVLAKHPTTGDVSLYLPQTDAGIQGETLSGVFAEDYIRKIEADPKQGVREYKWSKGDLLIWDNTTVMHRSMGGYFDEARLLFRVQARLSNKKTTKLHASHSSQMSMAN